jgi:hypothetical protein
LIFQVSYDFRLAPFQGSTLSYQRFLRSRLALRVGLSADADVSDDDTTFEFPEDEVGARGDLTSWKHRYAVNAQLLRYSGGPEIRFFYGGGPRFTYGDYRHESVSFDHVGDALVETYRYHRDYTLGVGAAGSLGAHWAINEWLAVHAEYALSVMHETGKEIRERTYSEGGGEDEAATTERRSVELDSEGVLFGLSVYF